MLLAYPSHKKEYKEELCRSEEDLISSKSCLMHIGYTVPSVLCTFSLSMEEKNYHLFSSFTFQQVLGKAS